MMDTLNNEKIDISSEEHSKISPQEEENMNTAEEGDGAGASSQEEKLDISDDDFKKFASVLKMDMAELKGWFVKSTYKVKEFEDFFGDRPGFHPLHVAAWKGAMDMVDMLITKAEVNVNIPVKEGYWRQGWTALLFAADENHEEMVYRLLMTYDADPNAYHLHPLHVVARKGAVDMVDMLITKAKVNVNIPVKRGYLKEGWTALHFAADGNHKEMVYMLIVTYGADPNAYDLHPLHVVAGKGAVDMVDMLITITKVDVNIPVKEGYLKEGWTALHFAADGNHTKMVYRLLVTYGADPNAYDLLPLHVAAGKGAVDMVDMLITIAKVDVNIPVKKGHSKERWTALQFAADGNHEEMVYRLLVIYGADPNAYYLHPLHVAAGEGAVDMVDMLITKAKVDVNIPVKEGYSKEGWTALQFAADGDHEEMVYRLLVMYGADPNARSIRDNIFPFHLVLNGRQKHAVKGFLRAERELCHQLDVSATDNEGNTALHLAAFGKHGSELCAEAVQVFLKCRNVKLTIENRKGETALDIAAKNKNWKAFDILRLKITSEVKDYNEPYYKDRQASVDAANAILVGAALIASVTFAAWLQPPLGYSTFYNEQYSNGLPAPPISNPQYASFDHHPMLKWFWTFNSLSFFLAIATVMSGAHSVLPSYRMTVKQEVAKLQRNLLITSTLLALSMVFVLLAFAIAGLIVIPPVFNFRASMYFTIMIGGGVSGVFLFRLVWNIFRTACVMWDKKSSKH